MAGPAKLDIAKAKLYYYPTLNAIYNVVEVKTDDDNQPVYVRMTEHQGTAEVVLQDAAEISSLRDNIRVDVRVLTDKVCQIRSRVKLQKKLVDELKDTVVGASGVGLCLLKLIYNSKIVDKESSISSLDNANEGMVISAIIGIPPNKSVFKRFERHSYSTYWSSNSRDVDAIAFIPNKNVIFCGFSLFSSHSEPQFEAKYWIYVDNNLVESHEDIITCTDFEDKYYFRITTEKLIDVRAGSKLEIVALVSDSFARSGSIYQYYGTNGEEYKEIENENAGLWTVEYSSRTQDTDLDTGNFPEIFYYV